MSYATCHTSGCENDGIPVDLGDLTERDPDTGQAVLDGDGNPQMMGVTCGPCGRDITDVTDTAPAAVDTTKG